MLMFATNCNKKNNSKRLWAKDFFSAERRRKMFSSRKTKNIFFGGNGKTVFFLRESFLKKSAAERLHKTDKTNSQEKIIFAEGLMGRA